MRAKNKEAGKERGAASFAAEGWYINTDNRDIDAQSIGIHSRKGRVARVMHDGTREGVARASAVARLIAEAPAMYEALRELLDASHDCRSAGERMDTPCPRGERARAILARLMVRGRK